MGYQLVFWQQQGDAASALDTYHALMNDAATEGLRPLPLTSILTELADEFRGWNSEPTSDGSSPVFWEDDDGMTVVELSWSDVHVVAELRPAGFWSGEVANRIIDVLEKFECPLFDPQTNERFDTWVDC